MADATKTITFRDTRSVRKNTFPPFFPFPFGQWKITHLCAVSFTACLVGAYLAFASVNALGENAKISFI